MGKGVLGWTHMPSGYVQPEKWPAPEPTGGGLSSLRALSSELLGHGHAFMGFGLAPCSFGLQN